jgi:uncharacterized protein
MTAQSPIAGAAALRAAYASKSRVLVALSGGVDSAVCMAVAHEVLGSDNAIGVTARSETLTTEEFDAVCALAAERGWNHRVIEYSELAIPNYAANPVNRCFFCKSELYGRLRTLADELGIDTIVQGTHADDHGDYRPGMQAAEKYGTWAPLAQCGMTKADVRALAQEMGLPVWDKPASPCLSSRFAYGLQITREGLDRVAAAESFLRAEGFRECRVRHHENLARIEVPTAELERMLDPEFRAKVSAHLRELGFVYVTLDLLGFRSGSMNEVLNSTKQ